MKKSVFMLILLTVICSIGLCSFAEETDKQGGFFNSIGSFFSDTWNDTTDWVGDAWEDTTQWIEGAWDNTTDWINGAWGDASGWINQAWDGSSAWVSDIWGDVSGWVSETVTPWWVNTFDTVTEDSKYTLEWVRESAYDLKANGTEFFVRVKDAVSVTDEFEDERVKEVILALLAKLNINGTDADKVWDTIVAYSEQKGLSPTSIGKISIPYIIKLCSDNADNITADIPALAVAQYLTGIIEKLGIIDATVANGFVSQLIDIFEDI